MSNMAAMSFDEMCSTMDADPIHDGAFSLENGPTQRRISEPRAASWRPEPEPRAASWRPEPEPRTHRSAFGGRGEDDEYEKNLRLDEDIVGRGLSLACLRSLAKRPVEVGERVEDPISRSLCRPGDVVYDLPCGHALPRAPALRWFKEHRTCPVCRHEVEA